MLSLNQSHQASFGHLWVQNFCLDADAKNRVYQYAKDANKKVAIYEIGPHMVIGNTHDHTLANELNDDDLYFADVLHRREFVPQSDIRTLAVTEAMPWWEKFLPNRFKEQMIKHRERACELNVELAKFVSELPEDNTEAKDIVAQPQSFQQQLEDLYLGWFQRVLMPLKRFEF